MRSLGTFHWDSLLHIFFPSALPSVDDNDDDPGYV